MRTCLSLLIIAGHLVAQAAALHVHSDDSHAEHVSLPHVHLSWFGDVPTRDAVGRHFHDVATTDEPASTFSESATHDSDAVYVAAVTGASQTAKQHRVLTFLTSDISVALHASSLSSRCVVPDIQYRGVRCCADTSLYHCALFLQLQTLRI